MKSSSKKYNNKTKKKKDAIVVLKDFKNKCKSHEKYFEKLLLNELNKQQLSLDEEDINYFINEHIALLMDWEIKKERVKEKNVEEITKVTPKKKRRRSSISFVPKFTFNTKRIIYSLFKPFEVTTKNTIGYNLFGEKMSNILNFIVTNKTLGILWMLLSLISLTLLILSMEGLVNSYLGFISSPRF